LILQGCEEIMAEFIAYWINKIISEFYKAIGMMMMISAFIGVLGSIWNRDIGFFFFYIAMVFLGLAIVLYFDSVARKLFFESLRKLFDRAR
jgi:divalent metal cation (Fe/Co/Zn/Cd) transporter